MPAKNDDAVRQVSVTIPGVPTSALPRPLAGLGLAAAADKASHDAEGGRKAEAGKGPGKGAGGHSGNGH